MQPYPRSLDLVWPGHLHGTGCLSAWAAGTGFPTVGLRLSLGPGCGWLWVLLTPARRGWGLGWVCLGSVCGVVPLLPAVCGVRGWALVSACFRDACGFARVSLAPRCFWFRCVVWACVLGPGLGCAPPLLAGLSRCVFCAFFFRLLGVPVPGLVVSPPVSFLSGWAAGFFFFGVCLLVSVPLFPVGRCSWLVVAGFGWVVPLCLFGGPVFGALRVGGLATFCVVGGRFVGCGLFSRGPPLPPPPLFFGGGGAAWLFLPLPSLGWRLLCGWCVVWLVPRHSWRRFLCATPRHSWLGFAAGGGGRSPPLLAGVCWRRWCVVCGVWRWCVGGVVAGVWCGWSLATPSGGSCVLLPATPGWVSLPVVVGGPRHSWLGSVGGVAVWCVVCGGGVLVGLWLVCGVVCPSPLLAEVPVCYSTPLLAGFRCRWWWAVPTTPGWGPLAALLCGVWCVAVVCWWGCGWCVVWLVTRHSWRRFLCATPRHSWLGFAAGGGGRSPPLLAWVRWRRCCVVCGVWRWCVGGVVAGVWCGWSLATPGGGSCVLLPATPGWVSLPVVVGGPRHSWLGSACGGGVWCVVCGVWRWCVCGVVAGVWCGWSLATPGGGSCVLLPATPGWVSLPVVAGGPRDSWLGSPGGGGVWCVVCGVWRWCVVGVAVGVWCGWSLATPGGGPCVLLPATPGWVSLPVVVGGPRHSWLGSVGGGGVWCVVCWRGPSPLLAEVPVCYSPPLLARFRCRWWWAVPATPGWGPLAAVVCGVWCVAVVCWWGCGWARTRPSGRRLVCVCVRVRALLGQVGRAGLPGAFWCASPFPLAALSFCFAWPPPGWGCPSLFCCCCRSSLVVFLGLPLPGSSCARASFCVSRLAVGCSLVVAPPPPSPFVSRGFRPSCLVPWCFFFGGMEDKVVKNQPSHPRCHSWSVLYILLWLKAQLPIGFEYEPRGTGHFGLIFDQNLPFFKK